MRPHRPTREDMERHELAHDERMLEAGRIDMRQVASRALRSTMSATPERGDAK